MNRNLEEGAIGEYDVSTGFLTRKIFLTHEGIYIPRWFLGKDDALNNILKRIKAPPIEIRGNHIYLEEDKLPNQTLFLSIERIAEHIVAASTNPD